MTQASPAGEPLATADCTSLDIAFGSVRKIKLATAVRTFRLERIGSHFDRLNKNGPSIQSIMISTGGRSKIIKVGNPFHPL